MFKIPVAPEPITCPNCHSAVVESRNREYRCLNCHHLFTITDDGVSLESAIHPGSIEEIEIELPRVYGTKMDKGKPDLWFHLFDNFPDALEEVAFHAEEGDQDPGHVHHGWRGVPEGYKRYSAALLRHMLQGVRAGDNWTEQVRSARAVAWNALARLQLLKMMDVTYGTSNEDHGSDLSGPLQEPI